MIKGNHKTKYMHLLYKSIAVALCLALFSGCLPFSLSGSPVEEEIDPDSYRRERSPVHFSQLTYVRPDLEEMESGIREHVRGIRRSRTIAGAMEHMKGARDILLEYDTMYSLCSIYYDMDTSNDSWYEEMRFCRNGYGTYYDLWNDVYWAISRSRYSSQLLGLWDSYEEEDYRYSSDYTKSEALYNEMDDVIDKALDILDHATVFYDGEYLTLDEAYWQEDWVEACEAWYEAYGEELLDLYTQMVKLGNERARDYYGYENYAEYIFDSYGRDYTVDQAMALVRDVQSYIQPLNKAIEEYGYQDNAYGYYMDVGECIELVYQVVDRMDGKMAEALDVMLEYELYFLEPGDYVTLRPYVIYLDTQNVPFMFCPFYDNIDSVSSITHEFGHFYECYVSMEETCFAGDFAETHSQSMSLLFAQTRLNEFGEGDLLEYFLPYTIDTVEFSTFHAAIELQVYALPAGDITPQAIGEIAARESEQYGYGSSSEIIRQYQWLTDSELFTLPLQALCYSTSGLVALDLWRLSLEDMDGALEKYSRLVDHGPNQKFLSNVTGVGLESPFAEGRVEKLALFLHGFLIEGARQSAA